MKQAYLLTFFILLVTSNFAQMVFEKAYGGLDWEFGKSVRQTADGGYILFGNAGPSVNVEQDLYLIKTDMLGNELWNKAFVESENEYGSEVEITSDDGFILCGTDRNGLIDTLILIKTDESGALIWKKQFPAKEGNAIEQTIDGGFVVTGDTIIGSDSIKVLLLRTDANGNMVWSKTYDRGWGGDVKELTDGYIVVASAFTSSTNYDVKLIRTDLNGDTIWTKKFLTSSAGVATSLDITTDGGFVFSDFDNFPVPLGSYHITRTDSLGNLIWMKTSNSNGSHQVRSIQQTDDGGFIFSGVQGYYPDSAYGLALIKFDSTGNLVWKSLFPNGIYGRSVQQTSDGGFVVLDSKEDSTGGTDFYLIKTNELGVATSTEDELLPEIFFELNPRIVNRSFGIKLLLPEVRDVKFSLFDMLGRKVFEKKIISGETYEINCLDFPNGILIAQLFSEHHRIWSGKICLQHN